jgi:hypothetical protein
VLLAVSSILRDRVLTATGGPDELRINLDLSDSDTSAVASMDGPAAARALGVVEEARAALADETNLNPRLVLERAFLEVAGVGALSGR